MVIYYRQNIEKMKLKTFEQNDLSFIEIDNQKGLKVTLCNLGASIYSIYFNDEIMTLTPKNPEDFKRTDFYHGKTIGAIANRVRNGKIKIGEEIYQMNINEEPNSLHGGERGISTIYFKPEIIERPTAITVKYKFKKPDAFDGLPGTIKYTIVYLFTEEGFGVEMHAKSDKDTVIALTNHSYFCLGDKNLDNLSFKIKADRFVETNKDDLLPVGIKQVPECLNFMVVKPLMKDINNEYLQNHRSKGYDHCFLFKGKLFFRPQIELSNDKYVLKIKTTYPAVQIYTSNYPCNVNLINSDEPTHQGITIEPQDSTMERVILKAKKEYLRYIEYRFYKK